MTPYELYMARAKAAAEGDERHPSAIPALVGFFTYPGRGPAGLIGQGAGAVVDYALFPPAVRALAGGIESATGVGNTTTL